MTHGVVLLAAGSRATAHVLVQRRALWLTILHRQSFIGYTSLEGSVYDPATMQTEAMVMMATEAPSSRAKDDRSAGSARAKSGIRVRAVALNTIDLWGRRGLPHFRYEFPHRLGADIAWRSRGARSGERKNATVGDAVLVNPGPLRRDAKVSAGHDVMCRRYRILGENTQGATTPRRRSGREPPAEAEVALVRGGGALPLCFLGGNMVEEGRHRARADGARAGGGQRRVERGDPDREDVRRARVITRRARTRRRSARGARRRRGDQPPHARLPLQSASASRTRRAPTS